MGKLWLLSFLVLMFLPKSIKGESEQEGTDQAINSVSFFNITSATVVISSLGGAAQKKGGTFGQYEYDEDTGYYERTSTEQSHEEYIASYLYRDEDGEWSVSSTPHGRNSFGLWNPNPSSSKKLQMKGWKYSDGQTWQDDPYLTVTPGPLSPLPAQFTVTATGLAAEIWTSYPGVFNRTESSNSKSSEDNSTNNKYNHGQIGLSILALVVLILFFSSSLAIGVNHYSKWKKRKH